MATLTILEGKYLGNYLIKLYFSDGTTQIVDFSEHFKNLKGYYAKYAEQDNFTEFKVEEGKLVWGQDWDIIFPTEQLYKNRLE
ncbi:MAG: DUF2442 domain-containing protein [Thermonemataceae bacterium]|nr:DUF2442 domain-containing protein [Thermonemataceae bacterium]